MFAIPRRKRRKIEDALAENKATSQAIQKVISEGVADMVEDDGEQVCQTSQFTVTLRPAKEGGK